MNAHSLDSLLRDNSISEEEKSIARQIGTQLNELNSFANSFKSAISLFHTLKFIRHIELLKLDGQWIFVPARDGAITLYNFEKCFESIRTLLHDCPSLKNDAINQRLRAAKKRFSDQFPSSDKLRHGVAHAGEIKKTAKQQKRHSTDNRFTGGGISVGEGSLVSDTLTNDTFRTTFLGRVRSYDLTQESIDNLTSIKNQIIEAFEDAPGDPDKVETTVN